MRAILILYLIAAEVLLVLMLIDSDRIYASQVEQLDSEYKD